MPLVMKYILRVSLINVKTLFESENTSVVSINSLLNLLVAGQLRMNNGYIICLSHASGLVICPPLHYMTHNYTHLLKLRHNWRTCFAEEQM